MRCQRCGFENPPSQGRCFRCGSILEGGAVEVGVYPPRMAKWKRPFRGLIRQAREVSYPVGTSPLCRNGGPGRTRLKTGPWGWR